MQFMRQCEVEVTNAAKSGTKPRISKVALKEYCPRVRFRLESAHLYD